MFNRFRGILPGSSLLGICCERLTLYFFARFCLYPQDIVLQLDRRTRLRKIQILSHQTLIGECRVEELALPTRAIQLSGEVLSTDESASAELREAEAVHRTRSSRRLFKAAPTTPCVCREQQLETGLSNKRLKRMLELLLHCGGLAEPRLLCTAVLHTAAVVWTGTTGTRPAHNIEVLEC